MKTEAARRAPVNLVLALTVMVGGLIVAIARPFEGLDSTGHIMLGTVIAALSTWIFRPAGGTFIIGTAIIFLGGSLAGLSMPDLAGGFASASLWLMIPAMFLGTSLMRTGLGKRMAYSLFRRLRLNYAKILIGWFVINMLFALINPSATVRFLILTPIAVSVADACQLQKGSRGRSLIVISSWALSFLPATAWMTGSMYGPVFSSFLPEGFMRDMATEQMWFRVMAPWILFGAVFIIILYFVLKPEQKLNIEKDQIDQLYKELGPMGRDEKGCLAAFVFMIICLIAQSFLPFSTHLALLASFILLLLLGVLTAKDISTGINWDTIAFFGIILSFVNIFEVSGITAWISPMLSALIEPIAVSPLLFVVALYGICVLIRFFDVAQGWISSAILALATPMLYYDYGIHPLIPIMVFICASNLFFFRYHQPWIVQVESVCGDGGWNPRHLTTASILYAVLAAAFLVFNNFYWQLVGIL